MKSARFFLFTLLFLFTNIVLAQSFYYHGRLTDHTGTALPGPYYFQVTIMNPAQTCTVYSEVFSPLIPTQTIAISNGFFSIPVGTGTPSGSSDPFNKIFLNTPTSMNCIGGEPTRL